MKLILPTGYRGKDPLPMRLARLSTAPLLRPGLLLRWSYMHGAPESDDGSAHSLLPSAQNGLLTQSPATGAFRLLSRAFQLAVPAAFAGR